MSSTTGADPVRASVRFPLHLQVVLRTPEREFLATTEDVSANGVSFVGDELPSVDTVVSFRLTMPAESMGGTENVILSGSGRIVRHTQLADGKASAAVVIDEYILKAEQV